MDIKSETVAKIKKRLRLSERATERVCNILRKDDVRVEHGTRQFLSEIDKLLVLYYHNIQLKIEVKVIHSRVNLVKGKAGKLQKKVLETKTIVKKERNVTIIKNYVAFCKKIDEILNISADDDAILTDPDGSFKSIVSVLDWKIVPERETEGEIL